LIGLFTNGHILVEGVPGVAKTTTIKTFSQNLDLGVKRSPILHPNLTFLKVDYSIRASRKDYYLTQKEVGRNF